MRQELRPPLQVAEQLHRGGQLHLLLPLDRLGCRIRLNLHCMRNRRPRRWCGARAAVHAMELVLRRMHGGALLPGFESHTLSSLPTTELDLYVRLHHLQEGEENHN